MKDREGSLIHRIGHNLVTKQQKKVVLRGKCIALDEYTKKKKRSKIDNLSFCTFRKQGKKKSKLQPN